MTTCYVRFLDNDSDAKNHRSIIGKFRSENAATDFICDWQHFGGFRQFEYDILGETEPERRPNSWVFAYKSQEKIFGMSNSIRSWNLLKDTILYPIKQPARSASTRVAKSILDQISRKEQ